jgi:hypothetical protein
VARGGDAGGAAATAGFGGVGSTGFVAGSDGAEGPVFDAALTPGAGTLDASAGGGAAGALGAGSVATD